VEEAAQEVSPEGAVGRPPLGSALAGAALLALVAGGLFFQDLGRYPLWDPDEARHAEVAREMAAARGLRRLFLPTLELQPYREKPAGYYWLVALAYGAGGEGEGAARGVSAVAALVLVLALYAYALPRAGVAGALGAGLVAATSAGWFGLARYTNLDMTLTACVTASVLAGLAWLERPPPRRPPLGPYVGAGLGMLVKGPIAAALIAGPLALAALVRQPRPAPRELGLARGIAIAGALAALLYAPLALLDASYLAGLVATHLRRLGAGSPHAAPVYYYAVWLPVLLFPWTVLAVPGLMRAARDARRRPLVLWAAFVPALLTLVRGKLATYALPALAPLALVAGPDLASTVVAGAPPEDALALRAGGWVTVLVLAAGAGAALFAGGAYPLPPLGRGLLAAAAIGWAAVLAVTLVRGRLRLVPAAVLGAALTLCPLAVRFLAPALAAVHSDRDAARLIARAGPAQVIAFAAQAPSLVFYLHAPVVHTDDPRLVQDLFQGEAPVFLVTGHRHFEEVERLLGAHAHRWHETARRRLYGNRPPPAG